MTDSTTVERHIAWAELGQFYAEQMAVLDDGDAEGWVDTFTEDGVFVPPNDAPEVKGRQALLVGTRSTVARLDEAGTVRRHVQTNMNLVELSGDSARTVSYVLVVDSTPGEPTRITTSTVMRDELVRDGARWLVARRVVLRDDADARGGSPS
ncbi:nuclear transport factor 2 family protein [Saccharothrix sp. S26]|uniref:nuclear transport factor 2 family protein n=1 Tax=Saccharothrix sp. S26 TaxID=2907215 RepID=UPI001F3A98B5|nr:nuclear transport factor 2 family protein [Saccharothrix sp. S26]MCE6995360.1 nuclear transport factor 2 family protein [Saccharothrix sp. S26]